MNSDMRGPSAADLLSVSFLENRARVVEIAAFLDRLDRYPQPEAAWNDHRYRALMQGMALLLDGKGERAARVLALLSDPTEEPLDGAHALSPVSGAWRGDVR
jgi:hypothetical protein